jgi:hypothetical protein
MAPSLLESKYTRRCPMKTNQILVPVDGPLLADVAPAEVREPGVGLGGAR